MNKLDVAEEHRERTEAESVGMPQRLYYLDWLRVLIILNLIPFHAAWTMTFVADFSQIPPNGVGAQVLRYYVDFPSYWHMPLLFFIAGAATRMALRSRSVSKYLKERIQRLLIPLAFYMVFLSSILSYFWPGVDRSYGISGYFLDFWPKYLLSIHALPTSNTTNTSPGWHHLWFVAYLFIFSVVMLPVFWHLNNRPKKDTKQRISIFLQMKGGLYLLVIPLVAICAGLAPIWRFAQGNLHTDWAYFFYNLTLYIYGFIVCISEEFWTILDRYKRPFLLLGIVCFILLASADQYIPKYSTPAYNAGFMLYAVLYGFNTWFWIVTLLGLARKYLSKTNRFLQYFNRASYPTYIHTWSSRPSLGTSSSNGDWESLWNFLFSPCYRLSPRFWLMTYS